MCVGWCSKHNKQYTDIYDYGAIFVVRKYANEKEEKQTMQTELL